MTFLFAFEDRQSMMSSITEHAIIIGYGDTKIYSFIDPLCPKSQDFIEHISTREDLLKDNTYYIFLYKLPLLASKFLIVHIYQSENQLEALQEVMIYDDYDVEEDKITTKTKKILHDIQIFSQKLNIKYRPYLLIFDKDSKYCRVSEGTAPCLEENDYH
ncbi:hypothetical protein JHD50_04845 [Sulfurimonas sp. MAG313]|nr:hypothetical protein [Sulfurimonas sp. MAG313]MDF1880636.1 hypothetical protein [Sulfurimonas sp. MAG313]